MTIATLVRRPVVGAGPFADVAAALAEEFGGDISREAVERCVAAQADRLGEARITAFLGVLVHKAAREQLRSRRGSPEPSGSGRCDGGCQSRSVDG